MTIGIGTIGVHKILAGLVEVATSIGNTRDIGHDKTVAPVQVTILGTVVDGILHGPDALHTILVLSLRTEVVVEVGLEVEATCAVDVRIAVLDDLQQVFSVDACHLIGCCIVLAISLIEVSLGEEGCSCCLGRATLIGLLHRKHTVGILHIVDNLLPALIIGKLGVGKGIVVFLLQVGIHDERNVLVETLQQEMGVGTQELHLA